MGSSKCEDVREDGSKDAAQANNAKKRLRELQKFAHAKCLRTPPVMEYRVAMFSDAGGSRNGFLGRNIGPGEVCSSSPRGFKRDLTKISSMNASLSTCSNEESRYFSSNAPLWVEDDVTHIVGHTNPLVYESTFDRARQAKRDWDWIFTRDQRTIDWELQREHVTNSRVGDANQKQPFQSIHSVVNLNALFAGFVFCLECIMKLAAVVSLRFLL